MNIHCAYDYGEKFFDRFKKLVNGEIHLTIGKEIASGSKVEILICGVPTEDMLTASDKLTTLIIPWAGLPKKTAELMKSHPNIAIHNIHHNATNTAEMAVTLMMTAMKRIIPIDKDLRKGDWRRRYADEPILSAKNRTAVIVGYGAIGQHIAKICTAMEMDIIPISRTGDSEKKIHPITELANLLPKTQVVFLALPLTDETRGLLGANELSLLPDDSVLINIARGEIIEQEALYNELKSGRIRGGLDVWYNYPPDEESREHTMPSDFPFESLDNVVMTPHLGGHSTTNNDFRAEKLAELVNAYIDGREIPNKISLERGY